MLPDKRWAVLFRCNPKEGSREIKSLISWRLSFFCSLLRSYYSEVLREFGWMKKRKSSKCQTNLASGMGWHHAALFKEGRTRRRHKGGKPHRNLQDYFSPWKRSKSSGLIKQGHAVGWQHLYKKQQLLSPSCEQGQWLWPSFGKAHRDLRTENAASALLFLFRRSASEEEGFFSIFYFFFFMAIHQSLLRVFGSHPFWAVRL